jgi:anti-sigma factor (TIGR02949 family)
VICADLERELDPYIDRELSPDSEAAVREHVDRCPLCGERLAARQALGRLVRSVPYYPAPDRLRARVADNARRARSPRRVLTWAAAAVLLVSIGGSVSLLRSRANRDEAIVSNVVDAHVRSLMAEHLVDVQSTDQHTVKPWFLGKVDFSPPVADLAPIGFPLVGGRLDYASARPVAALVYQRQKHAINVFVWPDAGSSIDMQNRAVRGFHVRHWVRDGMSFWVVSDLNDTELTTFVRALQAN